MAAVRYGVPPATPYATGDYGASCVADELAIQSASGAAAGWNARATVAKLDVSAVSVARHWLADRLKSKPVRGFKVACDPNFVEKPEDIVDLYRKVPEHALAAQQGRRAPLRFASGSSFQGTLFDAESLRGNSLRVLRRAGCRASDACYFRATSLPLMLRTLDQTT